MPYVLRLFEDRMTAGARVRLPALNRVLHVASGAVAGSIAGTELRCEPDHAVWTAGALEVTAGRHGARLLRYELTRADAAETSEPVRAPMTAALILEHPIDLDPSQAYLMRCDRVDFAPGGVALPHRHRGGGIRCLVSGGLEVRVEGHPDRRVAPGEAWFESGREPVYAEAAPDAETSFIRVSILPRAIRGQSSIMYVDPGDAARGKPRRYTVYVDEPIELP
jgi:hypothetical protein